MSYYEFEDSYALETTYGTSLIDQASDQTYLLGVYADTAIHPNPKWNVQKQSPPVGAYAPAENQMWKTVSDRTGMYTIALQNGIPLWMVQGGSSTAGTDPYTHTITAGALPSITVHSERTGTATDWAIQYTGVQFARMKLICDIADPLLVAVIDTVAKSAVDPNLDGTNAMLSSTPVLPPTKNERPYLFGDLTATWDGATLTGIKHLELEIFPSLTALLGHYWESTTYKGDEPLLYYEGSERDYTLSFQYSPSSDDIWDEFISRTNTKNMVLKWERSTNDYIQITCTDCWPNDYESRTPNPQGEGEDTNLIEPVEITVRDISIEVKDSIAGSYYGE